MLRFRHLLNFLPILGPGEEESEIANVSLALAAVYCDFDFKTWDSLVTFSCGAEVMLVGEEREKQSEKVNHNSYGMPQWHFSHFREMT